jgi:hypothetical protein
VVMESVLWVAVILRLVMVIAILIVIVIRLLVSHSPVVLINKPLLVKSHHTEMSFPIELLLNKSINDVMLW